MTVEQANYITELLETNPAQDDQYSSLDDQYRLIKKVLLNTFPEITGAVTVTQDQINALDDLSESLNILALQLRITQADINSLLLSGLRDVAKVDVGFLSDKVSSNELQIQNNESDIGGLQADSATQETSISTLEDDYIAPAGSIYFGRYDEDRNAVLLPNGWSITNLGYPTAQVNHFLGTSNIGVISTRGTVITLAPNYFIMSDTSLAETHFFVYVL